MDTFPFIIFHWKLSPGEWQVNKRVVIFFFFFSRKTASSLLAQKCKFNLPWFKLQMVADWGKSIKQTVEKKLTAHFSLFYAKINSFRLFFRGSVIVSKISYSSSEISFREVNVSKTQSGSCCKISNNFFFLFYDLGWNTAVAIVPVFCTRPGNELRKLFRAETQVRFAFF